MSTDRRAAPDIAVLICTWNRAAHLRELLETVVAQETDEGIAYEVIVVDNNSHDRTRSVSREFQRADSRVRYHFEPRSGRSNALNHGLAVMRAPIYTLADDDTLLEPDHVTRVLSVFRRNPDASWVGGRVVPVWEHAPPAWVDGRHWSALALCDYGEREVAVTGAYPLTLLAAAFRRNHVVAAGGYRPALGVGPRRIGGTEDADLFTRLWSSGRHGVYSPSLRVHHKVPAERLRKRYHRRWHVGHGRAYAVMRDPAVERSDRPFMGVPGHLVRGLVRDGFACMVAYLTLRHRRAFQHETRVRFAIGFIMERLGERLGALLAAPDPGLAAIVAAPRPATAGGVRREHGQLNEQ